MAKFLTAGGTFQFLVEIPEFEGDSPLNDLKNPKKNKKFPFSRCDEGKELI